ncbi:hypothetical protein RhiJN_07138 [Ceratobasidium sp. AG-Ba]|nr:hypothetical protein RhiJN_07138 [Ceratobasidium sp. AG-Ba]QRW08013.1 hypothetical protein RhiLY_07012 [Ceratobasidium sp. AG-Ba]
MTSDQPGLLSPVACPMVRSILFLRRKIWRRLSSSPDVGTAKDGDALGTVYLTEIYSSPEGLTDFCKTPEHDTMKEKLMPIIQADKLVITQVLTNGEFSK